MSKIKKFKFVLLTALVVIFTGVITSCDESLDEPVALGLEQFKNENFSSQGLISSGGTTVLQTRFLPIYHWWEWQDRNDRKGVCGETSYMVAIKTVATWNNIPYTMSLEQQNLIVNGTATSPNPYQLYNYWKKNDQKLATCDFARGKNFQVMVRIGQQERKLKSLLKQL